MPLTITNLTETDYQLPEDAAAFTEALLALLASPGETFIRAFDFAWPALFDEIKKADAQGIAVHALIDRREAAKPGEKKLLAELAAGLVHSDITLSAAGPGSPQPWAIEHDKALVVAAGDGGPWWCADGSTNLDPAALCEANTARIFRSDLYAQAFVAKFAVHRDWARSKHPEWQIMALPTAAK